MPQGTKPIFISKGESPTGPDITAVLTQVTPFFNGMISLILGLLLPASGATLSPLQVLMWAGLVFSFIGLIVGLIRRMASSGGS